jgi:hypothetical protein
MAFQLEKITELARSYGTTRLYLFGSAKVSPNLTIIVKLRNMLLEKTKKLKVQVTAAA